MTQDPRSKVTVVLKLLEEGDTMLCLDARHEGAVVPPEHAQNPSLRLVLNLNFPNPIDVTDEGVSANLAFGGRRFPCYIPMAALWAAFNPETMEGMMWPDHMPPEVQEELEAERESDTSAGSDQHPSPVQSRQPDAPALQDATAIKNASATTRKLSDKPQARVAPRQRGHLRVVK